MKKKLTIILVLIAILLLAVGAFLVIWGKNKSKIADKEIQEPKTLETPLVERPFVALIPRADGKEFTMEISRIKNTKTIEYEVVYLSQGLSRGVIGSIETNGENEVSRKMLLGSCSKDVCKYDEGVEEGTLTLRFRGTDGVQKFTTDFHLQQGKQDLTSMDNKFKLSGKFSSTTYYLTMSTIGLPEEVTAKIVGGPYGIFTAGSSTVKNVSLILSLNEQSTTAKLFLFNGKSSVEQTGTKIDNENLTGTVNSLGTFFVTE